MLTIDRNTIIEARQIGQPWTSLYIWINDLMKSVLLKTFHNKFRNRTIELRSSSHPDARTFSFRLVETDYRELYRSVLNVFSSCRPPVKYAHRLECFFSDQPEVHFSAPTIPSIPNTLQVKLCNDELVTVEEVLMTMLQREFASGQLPRRYRRLPWCKERLLAYEAYG